MQNYGKREQSLKRFNWRGERKRGAFFGRLEPLYGRGGFKRRRQRRHPRCFKRRRRANFGPKKFKEVSSDKEAFSEDWSSSPDISNSIRMYLSEMGKVPLLSRDEEITLARNIREREKELRKLVLESPITMREICNWEELVDQEEMTTKELMPRGKRTSRELTNMRKNWKMRPSLSASVNRKSPN